MDYGQMCPKYEEAASLLGKKWTGLLVRILLGAQGGSPISGTNSLL